MANGSRHGLFAVSEETYGVTPTNPVFDAIRITGTTLGLSKEGLQSEEIRGDRQIADFRLGNNQVGGDINFELSYGSFNQFLKAVLLADVWQTDKPTVGNSQIETGVTRQSFTFVRHFADLAASSKPFYVYRGVEINTLNLSISPSSMVTGSFSVVGRSQDVLADLTTMGTPVFNEPTDTAPLDSFTGVLLEGSETIAVITEVSLTLENGIEPRYVVGSKNSIKPSVSRSNLTGQITAFFEDSRLVDKFLNETDSSIKLTLPDQDGNAITLVIPRIKYTGGQPDVDGEGDITLTMPFQALYDKPSGSNIFIQQNTIAGSVVSPPLIPGDGGVTNTALNNIGTQGAAAFGIGITDTLPLGMSEMTGTRTIGHENYGNYQHTDGSIMCWIPQFYYRWGATDSPRATKYGLNALDVKSKYDFADVAAANAAGYAVHRAFYDDGKLKDGFFVDKYQASNNGGIASSIKNGIPLSSASTNAPFSALNGTPANTYAGAIDAIKTRGAAFFVTTLFVQKALSLLSMAHAQAATSVDSCAWYDSTGIANYPKGCNNDALGDVNDATVKYTATGYLKVGKTGSALPFAKTTHNGQANGVADLNGNMFEICLGVTQLSGTFYALKTTAKASALTSGATAANDAWGTASITANYESIGANIGALTGTDRGMVMGSGTQQVFSSATSGKEWQASCAGIPLSTGVDATGTDLFGHDRFYDDRVNDMCPVTGGHWSYSALSGVWYVSHHGSRANSDAAVGVRAALYK